jgi:hypothetical protein
LSGFAANQILTHGALALGGVEFELFGILYSRRLNTTAAIFWAIALVVLVWAAWIRRNPQP